MHKASSNFLGSSKSIITTMQQELTGLLQALPQAQDGTEGGYKSAQAAAAADEASRAIAACFMQSTAIFSGVALRDPMLPYKAILHPKDETALPAAAFPSSAQLDAVTNELELTQQQRKQLLEGLRLFSRIQEPLDQREAAIYARIKQLITQVHPGHEASVGQDDGLRKRAGGGPGLRSGSILQVAAAGPGGDVPAAAPTAAAAAAGTSGWEARAAAPGSLTAPHSQQPGVLSSSCCAVRPASSCGSSSRAAHGVAGAISDGSVGDRTIEAEGAGGWLSSGSTKSATELLRAASGGFANSKSQEGEGYGGAFMGEAGAAEAASAAGLSVRTALGELCISEHDELLRLVSDLKSVMYQLSWLDTCCIGFIVGQLSWKQMAQFTVAMYPHGPMVLFWARRLMTRSSMAWVDAVTAGGAAAAVGGGA